MPTTIPAGPLADVRDMYVVHRAFRREFGLLPDLIRDVISGDVARAEVVASHLDLVLAGLHMHHTGEDVVLWPLLLERVAPSAEGVEQDTDREGQLAEHHRPLVVVRLLEDRPEHQGKLAPGHHLDAVVAHGVPLLRGDVACGDGEDRAFLQVKVLEERRTEVLDEPRELLAADGRRRRAPVCAEGSDLVGVLVNGVVLRLHRRDQVA